MTPGTPTGDLLTIAQVCAGLPGRSTKRLHPSTITRWILKGVPSLGGQRVKLRAIRAGGRWLVSPAALDGFFAALSTVDSEPGAFGSATRQRSTGERASASALAAESLERRGA